MTPGDQLRLRACAKCGACSTVCPVYRQTGREYHTGRGKLHLLSKLDPATASADYAEILSHCLLCGACSRACSRNIPVAEILADARAEVTRHAGRHVLLRTLSRALLSRPPLLQTLAPLARLLKELRLPADSGLNLRLGLTPTVAAAAMSRSTTAANIPPETGNQATLPPPRPEADTPDDASSPSVFNGCFATFIEPGISQALTSLLVRAGLKPTGPAPGWVCCGLAAYSSGQRAEARRLAKINITAHAGRGPIVVACGSCAAHLSRYPELLADDRQWHRQAEDFASRIREFSQFLGRRPPTALPAPTPDDTTICRRQNQATGSTLPPVPQPATIPAKLKVMYHDPCHLRFSLRIEDEPRQLLARVPGLELTEPANGPQCCGHGGLFHLAHPESSEAILERLSDAARQSGAEVITTACSGCLLHLRQAHSRGYHQARVIHLAVLLDRLTSPDLSHQ